MHLEYDRSHYSQSSIGLPFLDKLQSANKLISARVPRRLNPHPSSTNSKNQGLTSVLMAGPRPISSLANEETVHLKWFEAFMRRRCGVLLLRPRVITTKSIIRIEIEQQTYADSNIVHEPAADSPEGFRGFKRCSKTHLLCLIASYCGIVPSRSF